MKTTFFEENKINIILSKTKNNKKISERFLPNRKKDEILQSDDYFPKLCEYPKSKPLQLPST